MSLQSLRRIRTTIIERYENGHLRRQLDSGSGSGVRASPGTGRAYEAGSAGSSIRNVEPSPSFDSTQITAHARRVRKFGRGRFAGESCRGPGGATGGSGGRRHARDGRSTLLPMVSSGRRDPPNRVALEDLSIGSTENFISDGRGERTSPPPVTQTALRNHWLTLTHPLESLSLVRRHAKLRPRPEATDSGFPWKSATTEFTNLKDQIERAAPRQPAAEKSERKSVTGQAERCDCCGQPLGSYRGRGRPRKRCAGCAADKSGLARRWREEHPEAVEALNASRRLQPSQRRVSW
jgi:hypothetical protein